MSRVTANKYMATNRGLFELKYFFTSAIAASGEGDAHSSEAVRHRIKEMIDAEPASDVLSDDKIVERLKDDGVDIARRTVAKYREALRIPSSVQRRRLKRIALGGSAVIGTLMQPAVRENLRKSVVPRLFQLGLTPWEEGSSFPARGGGKRAARRPRQGFLAVFGPRG